MSVIVTQEQPPQYVQPVYVQEQPPQYVQQPQVVYTQQPQGNDFSLDPCLTSFLILRTISTTYSSCAYPCYPIFTSNHPMEQGMLVQLQKPRS